MKTFIAAVAALPLLAAAHEPLLAQRGRRHSQRAVDRMLSRRAEHAEDSKLSCSVNATIAAPDNLAEGSLAPSNGCAAYHTITSGDTCTSVLEAKDSNLTASQFITLNPGALSNCWGLQLNQSYCVAVTPCLADGAYSIDQNCTQWAQASHNHTYRGLATDHNVTLTDLRNFNEGVGKIAAGSFYCISNQTTLDAAATSSINSEWTPPTKTSADAATYETPEAQWTSSSEQEQATAVAQVQAQYESPSSEPAWTSSTPVWTSSKAQWTSSTEEQQWTSSSEEQQWTSSSEQQQWTSSTEEQHNTWTQQTSTYVAPTTTTSWSEPAPVATTSEASNSNSGSSMSYSGGKVSYFYQNGVAGACGTVHPDTAMIAAVYTSIYDNGSNCGKQLTITADSGASIIVTVADECPTCEGPSQVDLSESAFKALGSLSQGIIGVSWSMS